MPFVVRVKVLGLKLARTLWIIAVQAGGFQGAAFHASPLASRVIFGCRLGHGQLSVRLNSSAEGEGPLPSLQDSQAAKSGRSAPQSRQW